MEVGAVVGVGVGVVVTVVTVNCAGQTLPAGMLVQVTLGIFNAWSAKMK